MTSFHRVTVGRTYEYRPVLMDSVDRIGLEYVGQEVRVVNKFGCPPANTMGHCYIETLEGKFIGLVCTNSLVRLK